MKIIFSRKGYDSQYGRIPSPIFADASFYSLPIPSPGHHPRLRDIPFGTTDLRWLDEQLRGSRRTEKEGVHLDPDLNKAAVRRRSGWRPSFGQDGAAQTHLANQEIGDGDLFLFFGWFRDVEEIDGIFRYRRGLPHLHCVFGWLQVGKIYNPSMERAKWPKWASDHPHVRDRNSYSGKNCLYVAADRLQIPGFNRNIPGGGVFNSMAKIRILTEPGQKNRSVWRLPFGFYPKKDVPRLSYHSHRRHWRKDKKGILLKTVGKGQEFVLDCDHYPETVDWLHQVFEDAPTIGSA